MEIDEAVGRLYLALYKMRKQGRHQEEYDAINILMGMLRHDLVRLRLQHPEVAKS